jgi:hypothetical protein
MRALAWSHHKQALIASTCRSKGPLLLSFHSPPWAPPPPPHSHPVHSLPSFPYPLPALLPINKFVSWRAGMMGAIQTPAAVPWNLCEWKAAAIAACHGAILP